MPALALVPVLIEIIFGFHTGGLNIIYEFITGVFNPSASPDVLKSALKGLETTLSIAIIAWVISLFNGIILGIISSTTFSYVFDTPKIINKSIKQLLAIPRSIHELIWGLVLLQLFGLSPWVAIWAISIPYSSLMARIFSEQIDTFEQKELIAIKQTAAGSIETLITALTPKLIKAIGIYGGYRLECAIRGATILGIFGLGGIGTELQLSIQSLQFKEMWTSLIILGITMITIEKIVEYWQKHYLNQVYLAKYILISIVSITLLVLISIIWLINLESGILDPITYHPIPFPSILDFSTSLEKLDFLKLTFQTINLTMLSAGIAIGVPPILFMFFPGKIGGDAISALLVICRLIPPPLSALIILFCTNPSVSVAALSLGIQNMGIMGRLLKENIGYEENSSFIGISLSGADKKSAWLYGKLSPQANSYLAYSAYRTDVILRETAIVGIVGGAGLGWQLQESLSSFKWAEVILITVLMAFITIIGEFISTQIQSKLIRA